MVEGLAVVGRAVVVVESIRGQSEHAQLLRVDSARRLAVSRPQVPVDHQQWRAAAHDDIP